MYKWYEMPHFGNFAGFMMVITATPFWIFAIIINSMNWAIFGLFGSMMGIQLWLNYGKQKKIQ